MCRQIFIVLVALSLIIASFGQDATTVDPAVASTTQLTAESDVDPEVASTTQLTAESDVDPEVASTTQIVPDSTTQLTAESTVDPAVASTTQIVPDSTTQLTAESTVDPVPASTTQTTATQLMCIQCDSSSDPNCKWTQDASSAVSCKNQPTTGIAQCYTQTLNNIVYRGCVSDRATNLGVCANTNKCSTCSSSNGCNNKAEFTCIQCNSAANSICINYPNTYEGTYCTNAVTQSTAVCYEASYNDVYYRGCLVDAVQQVRQVCTNDENNDCKTCTTDNCNVEVASSAWHNTATGVMVISTLILLTQAV